MSILAEPVFWLLYFGIPFLVFIGRFTWGITKLVRELRAKQKMYKNNLF